VGVISLPFPAQLTAQASRQGVDPGQFAVEFLRENLPNYATGTGIITPEDVDELSQRLSEGSEHLPILPLEVNDRASYYEATVTPQSSGRAKLTREGLRAMLKRIGEGAENRPNLPTSAFSRESFYEDRT
jgi:hypothetical protein